MTAITVRYQSYSLILILVCNLASLLLICTSAPMNAMGDKINSKKIAMEAGCFTIPGYQGEVESEDVAVKLAKDVFIYFSLKKSR